VCPQAPKPPSLYLYTPLGGFWHVFFGLFAVFVSVAFGFCRGCLWCLWFLVFVAGFAAACVCVDGFWFLARRLSVFI